jgi:sensor domain CHASE-containing protein
VLCAVTAGKRGYANGPPTAESALAKTKAWLADLLEQARVTTSVTTSTTTGSSSSSDSVLFSSTGVAGDSIYVLVSHYILTSVGHVLVTSVPPFNKLARNSSLCQIYITANQCQIVNLAVALI